VRNDADVYDGLASSIYLMPVYLSLTLSLRFSQGSCLRGRLLSARRRTFYGPGVITFAGLSYGDVSRGQFANGPGTWSFDCRGRHGKCLLWHRLVPLPIDRFIDPAIVRPLDKHKYICSGAVPYSSIFVPC